MKTKEFPLLAEDVYNIVNEKGSLSFHSPDWIGSFYGYKQGDVAYFSFSCGEPGCCEFEYVGREEWVSAHKGDRFRISHN